jgi:hypothetical protein
VPGRVSLSPQKGQATVEYLKTTMFFLLSLVLAPTPPIPKFFPFGIYEALPVVAKRAAGMEPITNDNKMTLSSCTHVRTTMNMSTI